MKKRRLTTNGEESVFEAIDAGHGHWPLGDDWKVLSILSVSRSKLSEAVS